jgi:hypothetical protein
MSDTTSDWKPRIRLILSTSAIALAFLSCCGCPTYDAVIVPWWGDVRAKQLQVDLDDRLPDGSSREQAEAWFASHGLTEYGIDYGDQVRAPKNGEPAEGVRCGMWGRITVSSVLERTSINITVSFDDNGKVKGRSVSGPSSPF